MLAHGGLRLGLVVLLALPACERSTSAGPGRDAPAATVDQGERGPRGEVAARAAEPALYTTPVVDQATLAGQLEQRCQQAVKTGRPVLLEFSAPWCGDCRRLASMKRDPQLAQAMTAFEPLVVNVGEFDQHAGLLESFGVKAIARWEVLAPRDCNAPVQEWPRLGGRTLEPTRADSEVSVAGLVAWLGERRGAASASATP